MSASAWDWSLASAEGLLTTDECSILLEVNFLDDDDILKNFPNSAPKIEQDFSAHYDISNTHLPPASPPTLYPPSPVETKPSRADLASDLLNQLDQCKQENIFSNWLEEKVELNIFEGANGRCEVPPLVPAAYPAPHPTEELLREFETVYGAVELTHLTPPQSPPGPATQLLLSYAHQAACPPQPAPQWLPPPQPELERELQVVEELVRHRAAELASPLPSTSSGSPPSSPRSCSDEEWSSSSSRPKPYSRGTDDRRSRKKEQNKNAATRYRQKKKAEIEVLLSEESTLRARHNDLGNKCADLQREIRYLKGLMRDLFKAKGLIK